MATSKIALCRRLVELGDERSVNTLRRLSLERLELMLEESLPRTVEIQPVVDDGTPLGIWDIDPVELIGYTPMLLPAGEEQTVIAPVTVLESVEAAPLSPRPASWAELIAAPFVFVFGLLRL